VFALAANDRMLRLLARVGDVTGRSLDQGVATVRFTRRPDRDARPAETAPASGIGG
jgi:hypothetical protein